MIPQVRGSQGCYLDNHRNDWRCARAVPALCENAPFGEDGETFPSRGRGALAVQFMREAV